MVPLKGTPSPDGHQRTYAFTLRPREGRAKVDLPTSTGAPSADALPKQVKFSASPSNEEPIKAGKEVASKFKQANYPKTAGEFFARLGRQFAANLKSAFFDPFVLIVESCFKTSKTKAGIEKTSIDPQGVALAAIGAVIIPPTLLVLSPVFILTCLADATCMGVTGKTIPRYMNQIDQLKRREKRNQSIL